MAMNYASLTNDLSIYMLRTDQPFLDKIPDLIQQGTIRVYNNAKDLGFEIVMRINNVVAGTTLIDKPSNWLENISIQMINPDNSEITFLLPRTLEFLKTYWPYYVNGPQTNKPKYYADSPSNLNNANLSNSYGNMQWLIVPNLNRIYNFEIIYLGIPLFNTEYPVNFLTQRYPDLLLYSCLIEASLFLDDEEKRNKYQMMFEKELETINRMNTDRSADRTIIRDNN
jgi:hypothetical protein